jgi:putative ABC transport system permease protein
MAASGGAPRLSVVDEHESEASAGKDEMEIGRVTPILFTLAFRNLFQDRVRLIVTLVGIVFSVVLFTVELGLFFGFQRTVTIMIDHASADLWIAPAETKSFEATALLDGRERFRALAVPGVAEVTPVLIGFTYWRKPDGKSSTPVFLIGSQLGDGGLQPWNLIEGSISDLAKPQAVAIDRSYFDRLGVSELGDSAEIGDQKARVVAVTKGIRSFTTTPYVFTSLDRARSYINAPPSSATYFTVRVAPGANVDDVRRQLASALPNLEIITSDQFRQRSRSYWLFGTGAGAALFGSAILGIIVGTVIVAQTLYSSTKDHLSEFATLRAMGSSRPFLYKVIVWQALMTAVIGFGIAASIGLIVARVSTDTALPIILPPVLIAGLFALTVGMSIASAFSAMMVVMRVDPVTVLAR